MMFKQMMIHRGDDVLGRTDRGISRSGKYNAPDAAIIDTTFTDKIVSIACMESYVASDNRNSCNKQIVESVYSSILFDPTIRPR